MAYLGTVQLGNYGYDAVDEAAQGEMHDLSGDERRDYGSEAANCGEACDNRERTHGYDHWRN